MQCRENGSKVITVKVIVARYPSLLENTYVLKMILYTIKKMCLTNIYYVVKQTAGRKTDFLAVLVKLNSYM